ncbi:MAG: pyridoxal phosphate-dependent decarboxylase family protein [Myxococcota bacterium]
MKLLETAARLGIRYVDALTERAVDADPAAVERLRDAARVPLPEHGEDALRVLERLDALGSPATVASAGPRYFGFVTGGTLPASLAASWLLDVWDQNAWGSASSPVSAILEETALRWVVSALGLPDATGGAFVTGATMANFTGLMAARHAVLAREGWDVERDGLFGAPEVRVVLGEEAHPTVAKSLALLGFGRERVTRVPVDDQGRMRADALPDLSGPCIVIAQAGNVNSGAFDPMHAICDRAAEQGAWVHVDGAFGLWALAAPGRAGRAAGVERADSWATDAHKWLNTPYDCGIALVRDARALKDSVAFRAPYLEMMDAAREPADYSPESSRRARGIEVWAALASLGRDGLADLVERCCRHAARFAQGLEQAGHAVLNDVCLNQVVVRFGDDATTGRVIDAIQRDGTCWCGPTRWRGQAAMRISVAGWSTTGDDVERSLRAILRIADAERGGA